MRECFCLLFESRNRLYYCSSKGRILSLSKRDKSKQRFLKEIKGSGHRVFVLGKKVRIVDAIIGSFFKKTIESYLPKQVKVVFLDGNKDHLTISNLVFLLESVKVEGGEGNGPQNRELPPDPVLDDNRSGSARE